MGVRSEYHEVLLERVEHKIFGSGALLQTLVPLVERFTSHLDTSGAQVGLYDLPSISVEEGWNSLTSTLTDPAKSEVLVRLTGEFDASSSERLLEELKVFGADGNVDLRLDLSGVGFFSASTIGVIVQLIEQFQKNNRLVTIESPSPEARRVFAACGLTRLLEKKILVDGEAGSSANGSVQSHVTCAQALGSWITVPPVSPLTRTIAKRGSPSHRPSSYQVHKNPLEKTFRVEDFAIDNPLDGTNAVGCGWS
jgi:anti-anti-sigma factor